MKTRERSLSATEFKAKCLRILDNLGPQGIIILKRGRPVAKLTPFSGRTNKELIGLMKGKIVIKGDLFSTDVKWNAQS
jgi:antitoxin (DNA-binding transcriptional repressor) of toxin-antitoxin stability system